MITDNYSGQCAPQLLHNFRLSVLKPDTGAIFQIIVLKPDTDAIFRPQNFTRLDKISNSTCTRVLVIFNPHHPPPLNHEDQDEPQVQDTTNTAIR